MEALKNAVDNALRLILQTAHTHTFYPASKTHSRKKI